MPNKHFPSDPTTYIFFKKLSHSLVILWSHLRIYSLFTPSSSQMMIYFLLFEIHFLIHLVSYSPKGVLFINTLTLHCILGSLA